MKLWIHDQTVKAAAWLGHSIETAASVRLHILKPQQFVGPIPTNVSSKNPLRLASSENVVLCFYSTLLEVLYRISLCERVIMMQGF